MYSPFTEVGRLAGEVEGIQRQINDCIRRWEIETIRNKIQEIQNRVERLENNLNELQNNFSELKSKTEMED